MKTRLFILFTALAFGLCSSALAQDWNTGSGLMSTGSSYSSTVTPVGATGVDGMATTAGAPNRGRTVGGYGQEEEIGEPGEGSPIGSSTALLLFAAGAAGVVAVRRRSKTAL